MLRWAHSHKQSLKYILGVIKNKDGASEGQFFDESYLGVNDQKTPLRIFKPNSRNKAEITMINYYFYVNI